jgi:hypothetical protein
MAVHGPNNDLSFSVGAQAQAYPPPEPTPPTDPLLDTLTDLFNPFNHTGIPISIETTRLINSTQFRRVPNGYSIVVGLRTLVNTSPEDLLTSLLHELTHIVNDSNYIIDSSGGGKYHAATFGKEAQYQGLITEWRKGKGYVVIGLQSRILDQIPPTAPNPILLPDDPQLKPPKAQAGPPRSRKKIVKLWHPALNQYLYLQGDTFVTEEDYNNQPPPPVKPTPTPPTPTPPTPDPEEPTNTDPLDGMLS